MPAAGCLHFCYHVDILAADAVIVQFIARAYKGILTLVIKP